MRFFNMERILECEICYKEFSENFRVPLVLGCGHSFCQECLLIITSESGLCPKCRKDFCQEIHSETINTLCLKCNSNLDMIPLPHNHSLMETLKLTKLSENYKTSTRRKMKVKECLKCEVCSLEYDEASIIPISLVKCGHTFCKPCVKRIAEENSLCPKCQSPLKEPVSSLPPNYSFLPIVNEYKSSPKLEEDLDTLNNLLSIQQDLFLNIKSKLSRHLAVNQDSLTKLEKIKEENTKNIEKKVKKIIKKNKEDKKQTQEISRIISSESKNSLISLYDFNGPREFLQEIYRRANNKENLVTRHYIDNNKFSYGKISSENKNIFFNSVDWNLELMCRASSVIEFGDLKNCLEFINHEVFINFSFGNDDTSRNMMLFIKMSKKNQLSNLFLNLCTGESGLSYSKHYKIVSPIKNNCPNKPVLLHFLDGKDALIVNHYTEYIFAQKKYKSLQDKWTDCSQDTVYVEVTPNGSFSLFRAVDGRIPKDSVGEVVSPSNISELLTKDEAFQNRKWTIFLACGIVINV